MDLPAPQRTEPAIAADERTTLSEFLDYYRTTLLIKVHGLSDDLARRPTVPPSDLNLMGLVRHMADVERYWFRNRFVGDPDSDPLFYGDPNLGQDPDGDHHPGPDDTLADALAAWETEVTFARTTASDADLDALSAKPIRDGHFSMRWLLVHMLEEYCRHAGHADLLRECADGVTGD
ncbi:DUF664 domain-containing protein [Nakamurella sp. YIM 132087]|uniref:DUF664 domain-containing protein n=1 Tax=Nakamurella alba TaxID=2665158 RepID=A0A7K1FNA8_9ACTN|nr:DinB family protein [Nakamurella alba]MTD15651.1 DUF664 domain-containing protein [Nakamurella alba]